MQKYIRTLSLILTSGAFTLGGLASAQSKNNLYEKDAQPIMRIPPVMPSEANTSGYCCMVFDINKSGIPKNIKAPYCTDSVFATPSKEALSKWRYSPAEIEGKPVKQRNATTYMSFRLSNRLGLMIPSPAGYLGIRDDQELTPPPRNDPKAYSEWFDKTYVTEQPCGDLVS